MLRFLVPFISILFIVSFDGQAQDKDALVIDKKITIVDRTGITNEAEHPVAFGKREFFAAIESSGGQVEFVHHYTQTNQKAFIILGTLENEVVHRLISDNSDISSKKPEGVFYQWRETDGGMALIIGGTDAIGLMYALNELAQQVYDKGMDALTSLENTVEFPDNHIRGLDKFIKDQNDDSWFFSEDYWQYYCKQLAKNRFNRLTLITGYNDGKKQDFMIPVYAYLFKLPGFEDVTLVHKYDKSPQEYLAQLKRIGQITHDYGLEFVFGIWGHGRSDELIRGLPEDDELYTAYCANGMKELLYRVPEIDGIQLRVNYESGVGGFGNTAEKFWKEIISAIGDIYIERQGNLFLDLRAKGLTVKLREWALETGINVHVTSKYSWEGVGLPYHPMEMRKGELTMLDNIDKRQRYGYADFLYKSRDYDFIYRLWGIGTMRMLTWADPDYAKRFSYSASFGGSRGFQVTPPLARKQNTWNLFNDDSLAYYKWEDQRYWAWYELFGRLGYSIETSPDVWERSFREHYGNSYEAVLKAYSAAGKVLPLITSSHLTFHPANYNWAEMDSGGAMFVAHNANPYYIEKERTYQSAEPGDPGMFYIIEEYVKDVVAKDVKPKVTPVQLATLYQNMSKEILGAIAKVDKEEIPETNKKEYVSNEIDLKITAALSSYHSYKTKAATDFVFFQVTQSKGYLKSSLINMEVALKKWKEIVALTQKSYDQKPFFIHDNGTWDDRLIEIEKDIKRMKEILGDSKNVSAISHWDTLEKTNHLLTDNFEATVPVTAGASEPLKVTLVTGHGMQNKNNPMVHYRIADMTSGKFDMIRMSWNGTNYEASIPAGELNTDYDLIVYFTSVNDDGNLTIYPGLFHENQLTPYYVVAIE